MSDADQKSVRAEGFEATLALQFQVLVSLLEVARHTPGVGANASNLVGGECLSMTDAGIEPLAVVFHLQKAILEGRPKHLGFEWHSEKLAHFPDRRLGISDQIFEGDQLELVAGQAIPTSSSFRFMKIQRAMHR